MRALCVILGWQVLGSVSSLSAQEAGITSPVGLVETLVPGPATAGSSQSTMIANTLRNPELYEGVAASVGAFTAPSSQILNTGVTTWPTGQWMDVPHICYIENSAGAEEAYLITAVDVSTGAITLSTTFDLSSRYPSTPKFSIIKAHTFASLFGSASSEVLFEQSTDSNVADNVFLWNGNSWTTYYHDGTAWLRLSPYGNANDEVIFPDEGMFILRRGVGDITLKFTGTVPPRTQISTVPGERLTMINNRYPVGTKVIDLGLHLLPDWKTGSLSTADLFYVWNSNTWVTYYHNGTNWKKTGSFGNVNNEVLPANTALYVKRISVSSALDSANTHLLPYSVNQ